MRHFLTSIHPTYATTRCLLASPVSLVIGVNQRPAGRLQLANAICSLQTSEGLRDHKIAKSIQADTDANNLNLMDPRR